MINSRSGHYGLNVSMKKFNGFEKVVQVDKKLNLMIVAMMSIKEIKTRV